MFSKKNTPAQTGTPNTIIGNGVLLEAARLTGKDTVRIDGMYRGSIDIDGSLVLGDTGSVTGDIRAKYLVVAGRVNGNIKCDSVAHFTPTAKVVGDVDALKLVVDEGSQIMGRYHVGESKNDTAKLTDKSTEKSYLDKSLEIAETQTQSQVTYDLNSKRSANE